MLKASHEVKNETGMLMSPALFNTGVEVPGNAVRQEKQIGNKTLKEEQIITIYNVLT